MLGFLFGFNARLGRLHYFLGTIALAVGMIVVIVAITSFAIYNIPSAGLIVWTTIVSIGVFMWFSVMLQSMRIRDIGWDPVCVIPGWFALLIIDKLVASKMPAWSFGHEHHSTVVGSAINFGLVLALTFWPSGDYQPPAPTFGEARREPPEPPRHQGAASLPVARITPATGAGFGRRGL